MANFDKDNLRRAALNAFGEPSGMTWYSMTALLDFFEDVRQVTEMNPYTRLICINRLLGVLDFLKMSAIITGEQYETLASLMDAIE